MTPVEKRVAAASRMADLHHAVGVENQRFDDVKKDHKERVGRLERELRDIWMAIHTGTIDQGDLEFPTEEK